MFAKLVQAALIAAVVCMPAGVAKTFAAGDDVEVFRDPFNRQLAEGWSLVREQKGALKVGEGVLEIRSLPGVIAEAKNLLVREPPAEAGALAIEVAVSNEPTGQWEQLGIVYYQDDAHHVKLVKERVDEKLWIVMGKAHPSQGGLIAKLPLESNSLQLRLVVDEKTASGFWRAKTDDAWTKVGDCTLPQEGRAKIGLVTFHGPMEIEHWARFEGFRILRAGAK